MTNDAAYVVAPEETHTHTIILLHGRDSNAREFANELFESEASRLLGRPRTLSHLFPTIRWVFPSAPVLESRRFRVEISQWFDIWSVERPTEQPELQHPGLRQSIERILDVIKNEETLVPRERIFLGGISQGFATAIASYLADTGKEFAGLIGLCSWMPVVSRAEDDQRCQDTTNTVLRSTPIFLSHSADDDVVPIDNGRKLRDALQSRQLEVEWKEYEDGGHWVNEPQGVDDIADFIVKHMDRNYMSEIT